MRYYNQFVSEVLEITPGAQCMLKLCSLLEQGAIQDQVKFVVKMPSSSESFHHDLKAGRL